MATTSTYLFFVGQTEAAFSFYREVFKTELVAPPLRMRDLPADADGPAIGAADPELIVHIELPIVGGHVLMGSDALPHAGGAVVAGTSVLINLEPDTRAESKRLFSALSVGGTVTTPLHEALWGAYFGRVTDKFGVHWRVTFARG
jgi:PhnB protein